MLHKFNFGEINPAIYICPAMKIAMTHIKNNKKHISNGEVA